MRLGALTPEQLQAVNTAIAAKADGGSSLTLDQLLNLPSNRTLFSNLPNFPGTSEPDLRFLPGIGSQMERGPDGAWKWNIQVPGQASGVLAWAQQNQVLLIGGAAALLLVLYMGGRRR